ncbi:MAG: DUF5906 domain-containing protein, partial [Methanothrix sp.]
MSGSSSCPTPPPSPLALTEWLGVDERFVPPCLEWVWQDGVHDISEDEAALITAIGKAVSPNARDVSKRHDARKAVRALCLLFRDHVISKPIAEQRLIEWRNRTQSTVSDDCIRSEIDVAYSSEERLSCDLLKQIRLVEDECRQEMCSYPRDGHPPRKWRAVNDITIEDVTIVSGTDDLGQPKLKFSPDKAADAILKHMSVVSTPDDRIWVYRDGIYVPDSEWMIDDVLDRVARDLYTLRARAETLHKIRIRTRQEYSIFNQHPTYFCCQNAVIDMSTGKVMDHSPTFYLTQKAQVKYDPGATCPQIDRFLETSIGDPDNIRTVYEILAAKTTDLRFEYFVALIGSGSNGKLMLEKLIYAFYGSHQITDVPIETLGDNRFDRVHLMNKKFLINAEVRGSMKEVDWIKRISGGNRIHADQKYKKPIEFDPTCLIIFDTNDPPRFEDNSYGFKRRLIKIDFPFKFVDDPTEPHHRKRDPFLEQKITSPGELSGLLNRLIKIAPDVIASRRIYRKYTEDEAAQEYDYQSHSMDAFADLFIAEADVRDDPYAVYPSSDLYQNYLTFCQAVRAVPVRDRIFNSFIERRGFERGRRIIGENKVRIWKGMIFDGEYFSQFITSRSNPSFSERTGTRTGRGPAEDQLNRYQDQQDQQEGGILYHMQEENENARNRERDIAGPAGPAGPAIDFAGPEQVTCRSSAGHREEIANVKSIERARLIYHPVLVLVDLPPMVAVDGRTYRLKAGDVVMLPEVHITGPVSKGAVG